MPLGRYIVDFGGIFSTSVIRRRSSSEQAIRMSLPAAIRYLSSNWRTGWPLNSHVCSCVTTTGMRISRPSTTAQALEPSMWL